jgi:hypothetical protein
MEFFSKLQDIYPKYPSPIAIEEYRKKLIYWKVSDKILDELFKVVTEKCAWFPTMAVFLDCAELAGITVRRKAYDPLWQCFIVKDSTFGDTRKYYRKVPNVQTAFPDCIIKGKHVFPSNMAYVQPTTKEEAKETFLEAKKQFS